SIGTPIRPNHLTLMSFISIFISDTQTPESYTLSLHDALPICRCSRSRPPETGRSGRTAPWPSRHTAGSGRASSWSRTRSRRSRRSEEHTSELQSLAYLVCRLLLEKKKQKHYLLGVFKHTIDSP